MRADDNFLFAFFRSKESKAEIDENLLNQLPVSKFKRSDFGIGASREDTECVICLQDYEEGEELLTLVCFHKFHSSCIKKCLKTRKECPVCKTAQKID